MSRIKPEVAQRRIESFTKSFGEAHLYLAYHAAFPLALTPDLLYDLWVNFQKDIYGQVLSIPWIAVADLLLSVLCDEVGHELYEMDLAVRNQLLEGLRSDERFGGERIEKLSDFLLEYAQKHLQSDDPDIQDFAKTQKWIALAYTKPIQAARELALEFSKLDERDKPEVVRMASLTETLTEPLAEFQPLLMYAYGMGEFAGGDLKSATAVFSEVLGKRERNQVQVNNITLPVPKEIIQEIQSQDKPTNSQKNSVIINTTTVLSYINLRIFIGAVSLAATFFPILFTNPNFFLESSSINTGLRRGDNNSLVKNVQSCLRRLGYFNGPVNGNFGPMTEDAVRRFQRDNEINAIGVVGPRTQAALNHRCGESSVFANDCQRGLRYGCDGAGVTELQQNLRRLGVYNGPVTGRFRQLTKNAVINFQRQNGISPIGVVEPQTRRAILLALNPPQTSEFTNQGQTCDYRTEIIRIGCRSEWIRQMQQRLKDLGYFSGNPSGYFGQITRDAVVRFQRDNRLPVTGSVDRRTWTAMNQIPPGSTPLVGSTTLTVGNRGSQVITLQQNLKQLNYFDGNPTGIYDRSTQEAVLRFQQSYGLPMTGNVDPRTSQAILTLLRSTGTVEPRTGVGGGSDLEPIYPGENN